MHLKREDKIAVAAGFAVAAGVLFWIFRDDPSPPSSPPAIPAIKPAAAPAAQTSPPLPPPPIAATPPSPTPPPAAQAGKDTGAKAPFARLTIKPGQPIPELFPHQEERDQLIKLASTYDAKSVPLIAPYLNHEDSTVRQTARQAMVQLGRVEALPYLKEAARKTKDRAEAQELQEIIEFLSLARASDVIEPSAPPLPAAPQKS